MPGAAHANSSRLNGSMIVLFRSISLSFAAFLFASFGALAPFAAAQGTHLWTQSRFEEFEKGTPDGVAIGSDGRLFQGPALKETLTTPSTFVWSVATNKSGVAFLGTGSPATVLRVDQSGKSFTLFESKDLSVQAVEIGPDGALYTATLPSGKVYKLDAAATEKIDEQKATVVFDASNTDGAKTDDTANADHGDAKSHYIWDLTFDSAGRLYIATGGPGAVYRVDPKTGGKPELFFKSDEQHIRALAWDAKGNLIAGSDGSGLIYRISPDGKGYVLFEAPRREITSVAVGADGTIYAASVGDKSHNPLPPLPVQGVGAITITIVQPGSLQAAANASTSIPEGTDLYALKDGQAAQKLWSSKDDIVYALAAQSDGLLALSGNRGHIFRIEPNGDSADVAHLEAQQGLCVAHGSGTEMLIGTGNTGKLFTLGGSDKHEYASDVLDAGALARFGRVEIDPGSSGYEIWTRSGNVEQPVRGWSDWTPLKEGEIASPAGRFLQWKAVLSRDGVIGGVGVNYLPVNAAPVVDEVVVVPGARLNTQNQAATQQTVSIALPSTTQGAVTYDAGASGPLQALKDKSAITVRWGAHDDNGDDLEYKLYLRGDGEHVWRLLKDDVTDKAYSFDASLIPDGGYEIKVVASDAPSHTPGDALTGEKVSDRFEVDTTSPVVTGLTTAEEPATCAQPNCAKPVHVTFEAADSASPIAHAEYSLDAEPWKFVAPVGELSDAKHERYDYHVQIPDAKPGEHLLTVRVYDRYDNIGVAKTVFTTTAK
jgi:WD40 repeat protein